MILQLFLRKPGPDKQRHWPTGEDQAESTRMVRAGAGLVQPGWGTASGGCTSILPLALGGYWGAAAGLFTAVHSMRIRGRIHKLKEFPAAYKERNVTGDHQALDQAAQRACVVSIFRGFKTQLDKTLSCLVWSLSWPCLEQEVGIEVAEVCPKVADSVIPTPHVYQLDRQLGFVEAITAVKMFYYHPFKYVCLYNETCQSTLIYLDDKNLETTIKQLGKKARYYL